MRVIGRAVHLTLGNQMRRSASLDPGRATSLNGMTSMRTVRMLTGVPLEEVEEALQRVMFMAKGRKGGPTIDGSGLGFMLTSSAHAPLASPRSTTTRSLYQHLTGPHPPSCFSQPLKYSSRTDTPPRALMSAAPTCTPPGPRPARRPRRSSCPR